MLMDLIIQPFIVKVKDELIKLRYCTIKYLGINSKIIKKEKLYQA